uniref:F-box associated domain-containing protein n=1 Tax=Chenopodium quinoa TaxID=63459 RepID=A0A803MXU5_CHEQI
MDTKCSIGLIRSKAVALNGALHWLVDDNLILRYDLDENKFEFVPKIMVVVSYLGVLDGMLCVGSSTTDGKAVEVWVMKEYGVEKSWTRFTIIHELDVNNASFQLIPELKDGKVLILTTTLSSSSLNFFLDVYDPKEKKEGSKGAFIGGDR